MDKSVVEALRALPESRRFMKGLFAWAGFRTAVVDYHRDAREGGESKFNAWKLWNFAIEGITSFSIAPLRIWTYIGALTALIPFAYAGYIVVRTLFFGVDVPGYASLLVSVMFLGGVQLIGIGILGEYLGRTYIEAKRRPTYLVRRIYEQSSDTE
jgi:glycosyltransferase involved in cell wall biosynthesis